MKVERLILFLLFLLSFNVCSFASDVQKSSFSLGSSVINPSKNYSKEPSCPEWKDDQIDFTILNPIIEKLLSFVRFSQESQRNIFYKFQDAPIKIFQSLKTKSVLDISSLYAFEAYASYEDFYKVPHFFSEKIWKECVRKSFHSFDLDFYYFNLSYFLKFS